MRNLVLVALTLFALASSGLAADRVRLSISSLDVAFLTAAVAAQKGFFKEEGIEPEIIRMSANVSITALATGDLDYTMIFGSVVRAAVRGMPLRVVASLLDSSTHTLIARSEFKSVKELRGKTLGVSSFGATADVAARMMLRYSGIDPDKEIKVVALGGERARFAALKEGMIEVAVLSPPADSEGKKMGFNVLARASELFSFPFVGLGTNVKKIKERPDEVKRVIKALIKANRYIRANRQGAIEVLTAWGRSDPESAAASYDSTAKVFNADGAIPDDGLRLVIEQARQGSKVTREVPLAEVADTAILKEAQKELGLRSK